MNSNKNTFARRVQSLGNDSSKAPVSDQNRPRFCRRRSTCETSTSFDNGCLEKIVGNPLSDEGKAARALLFTSVANDASLFRELQEQLRQSRYTTGAGTVTILNDSKFLQHMGTRVLDAPRKIKHQDSKPVDSCQRDTLKILPWGLVLPRVMARRQSSVLSRSAPDVLESTHDTFEPQDKPQYVVVEKQLSWRSRMGENRRRRKSMAANFREEENFHCPDQQGTPLENSRQQSHGTQPLIARRVFGWSRTRGAKDRCPAAPQKKDAKVDCIAPPSLITPSRVEYGRQTPHANAA
jgi:hypothetical protein